MTICSFGNKLVKHCYEPTQSLARRDYTTRLLLSGGGRDQRRRENWLICMSGREFPYPGDREAIEDFVAKGGMVGTRIGPKGIVESEGEADNYQKEMEKKMFDEEAQINLGTKSPLY